jgi:hypothetical protein
LYHLTRCDLFLETSQFTECELSSSDLSSVTDHETDECMISSSSECSSEIYSDDDDAKDETMSHKLFDGSDITVHQFSFAYLKVCNDLKLSSNGRDVMLDFIRYVMPKDSKIPKSFRCLQNSIDIPTYEVKKECRNCKKEFKEKDRSTHECSADKIILDKIYCMDIVSQIERVLTENLDLYHKYQSKSITRIRFPLT